ncbi:hydrophobin 1 [Lentinula edodes]|uniref:hydrophobin 1 n=1 Tax=Lentinula edodes TaxID=5353 RepID=UPI001E8E3072|nr:hydrophobin 1 [Lentinula edodes]KAH7879470.1 hydrophobin 1 [Lentinula edodes]
MLSLLSKAVSLAILVTAVVASPAGNGVEWSGGGTTTVTVTASSPTTTVTKSQCSTGDQKCCQSVQNSSAAGVSSLLGLLGIVLSGTDVPVGLTCLPIVGGACQSQAVCCTDNSYGNLISLGCSPLQL